MKKVIKNNYKFILGVIVGLILSITTVYAVEAYIESNKVAYTNHNKTNVEEAIDELYERSGIHQEKWIDPILNGADPVLNDPLIPVEIKPNGEVYYANLNSEWYNYSEKRWANAVILIDNPSNTNYQVGDHIIKDDIKGYFVWIPRYQYKIWNLGNYNSVITNVTNTKETATAENALWRVTGNSTRIIDIKFGDVKSIPKMSEPSTTGVYYTHPAFTLGNKDLNGIWVGKFETGGSANNVVVKPNVNSWRNETVKVFFDAAKGFAKDLDSHMMKNTEWGAVAYLSHSEYGIGNEVNINNTSDYMTGYSAAPNTDQSTMIGEIAPSNDKTKTQSWNTPVGYLASTTGNISGIYDIAGGGWEYVAAYRKDSTSKDQSGFNASEITDQISVGYIDGYASDSEINNYNKRILGDATGEMGPFYSYYEGNGSNYFHSSWYGDRSNFVDSTYPWFIRGGQFSAGVLAGLFVFDRAFGGGASDGVFRLVLSPTI